MERRLILQDFNIKTISQILSFYTATQMVINVRNIGFKR